MRIRIFLCCAILCAIAGLIVGCGQSVSPQTSSSLPRATTVRATATPAASDDDIGKAGHGQALGQLRAPNPVHGQKSSTPTINHEILSGTYQLSHPCALVSQRAAAAIVGAPIAGRIEAPLGPTCIFRLRSSRPDITLAVESLPAAELTKQMRRKKEVRVRGHRAFCGKLGAQVLVAPLPGSLVLNVTAPCSIGKRFAAIALAKLMAQRR
jgi:hypothetical protein